MIAAIHLIVPAFLVGNLALHGLPQLPPLPPPLLFVLAIIGGAIILIPSHLSRICGAWIVGFCWTALVAVMHADDILPAEAEGRTLDFSGEVVTIPKRYIEGYSFIFRPDQDANRALPERLSLKIYQAEEPIRLHSRLQLTATLKRPYGYANPGLFDYEKWLFAKRIGGSGYVRDYRLLDTPPARWSPGHLRQELIGDLTQRRSLDHGESIAALGLGFAGALPRKENDKLVGTGTRHLFAVSGLHVNLVFGFFVLILRALWSRTLLVRTQYPAYLAALWGALPVAIGYALLAGFSLPTQRALIMLTCFVVGWQLHRRLPMSQLFAIALLAVLAYDPLATLSLSFWLSFIAVALIIFYVSNMPPQKRWYQWGMLQVYLSLAMGLVAMLLFSRGALGSPLANVIAVPFVGLLLLPACLLAVGALWVGKESALADWTLAVADWLFSVFWKLIGWFYALDLEWFWQPPWWVFGFALAGILLPFALVEVKHRLFALLLLLPLLANPHADSAEFGEFKADFLDIGQGLSVVVRTQKRALMFDTGPAFRSGFNTGEAVGIPYLRSLGIDTLDTLIVSHSDNDHAGSAEAIRKNIRIEEELGGEAAATAMRQCEKGKFWTWDGVSFEILHPAIDAQWEGNNASCVLRISNSQHSLLLTGDIEAAAERSLIAHPRIASDVVLVPHHGSRTSSTAEFVRAVSPSIAVVTSGYRNHFGFPFPDVLARYRGAKIYNTATDGMISLSATPGAPIDVVAWRRAERKYWRHQAP